MTRILKRVPIVAFAVLLAAGCIHVTSPAATREADDRPVAEPLVWMAGLDSEIRERTYLRITNAAEWKRLWKRHLGSKYDRYYGPNVDVDFERVMVIAIFNGAAANTRGIEVTSVHESEQSILIRFNVLGYQTITGLSTNLGRAATQSAKVSEEVEIPDTSFAFIVLLRSERIVVLDEDKHTRIDDPPAWVEVARLKAR